MKKSKKEMLKNIGMIVIGIIASKYILYIFSTVVLYIVNAYFPDNVVIVAPEDKETADALSNIFVVKDNTLLIFGMVYTEFFKVALGAMTFLGTILKMLNINIINIEVKPKKDVANTAANLAEK